MAVDVRINRPRTSPTSDYDGLAEALQAKLDGEVRFDNGSRALYAADASNYRQVPIGVVLPRSQEDILQTIALCREFDAPVLSRGGGTSLAGQTCNVAVVMDMSKYYNKLIELDPERKIARVQPGIVLDTVRDAAEQYDLTFGPDPATHNRCTIGGMLGNNSCGVHALMAGRTVDNTHALDIVTYDGRRMQVGPTPPAELESIMAGSDARANTYARLKDLIDRNGSRVRERFPDIPRRVSGYSINELLPENQFNVARSLVGSEGTCVTILEATLDLVHSPPYRVLAIMGFKDVYAAADSVPRIKEFGPVGLEGIDDHLIRNIKRKGMHTEALSYLPDGNGWLLVEFGGDSLEEAKSGAQKCVDALANDANAKIYTDLKQQEMVWEVRESGLGATAFVPGQHDAWPGWEDSAVPPDKMGDYLRDFRGLLNQYDYECALYGHFGDGCLHVRIDFDLTSEPGIQKYRSFVESAADMVKGYGGSFSGEHGDGQSRGELLPKMFGNEVVEAFREFKSIWDPDNRMNPGKVVDPNRLDENLRLGVDYAPKEPKTNFTFPLEGSFSRATLHCVGVGKCRRDGGGTMCPSFQVTHEEKHSTRGRAHLLFEMLEGEVITEGWKDESVKEALDLCLACKGCKSDCPVNVDMATYKAEFLSHYYEGRIRPRTAYAFGLIFLWARAASRAPKLVNFLSRAPLLNRVAKFTAGVAQGRDIPKFADETFRGSFQPNRVAAKEVMLWPDTFNNYFTSDVAKAAARVLDTAGFNVSIPEQVLCCGRPLYDYGMLGQAKRQLQQILDVLREPIRKGTPIVVLEPSCLAVFRDELLALFPNDQDAQRLAHQTFSLGEFLHQRNVELPKLNAKAIIQGHCHQKALFGMDNDVSVLQSMGVDCEVLESGCCGMAGSFGFEAGERYDVSVAAGEQVLAPAVRKASGDTLVMADGFSCREQILQLTGRDALHLAQVIDMAQRRGTSNSNSSHKE